MKLWKKLAGMTALVLLAAMGASGAAVIYRSALYNQQKTVESCEHQLKSTAYAIGRELESGLLENYSEPTRNSYINYVVKKYGAGEYILIEDDHEVCNLTPFQLKNPGDERWNSDEGCSLIQKREEKYILISGKRIPMMGEA